MFAKLVRARRGIANVTPRRCLRIDTVLEPCPTVRPRIFERQLTMTRPLALIGPLTRS
jgi:hypothetical protein